MEVNQLNITRAHEKAVSPVFHLTFFILFENLPAKKPPAEVAVLVKTRRAITAVFSDMFTALAGSGELAPKFTSSEANP